MNLDEIKAEAKRRREMQASGGMPVAAAPTLNFDEPVNFEALTRAAQRGAGPVKDKGPSTAEAILRGAAEGLTFGFSDTASSWAANALARLQGNAAFAGDAQDDQLAYARQKLAESREAHPWAMGAAEVGAGMVVPLGAVAKGLKGATTLTRGARALQAAKTGAKAGALTGAIGGVGSGNAETLVSAAGDALTGGLMGGALGFGLGGLGGALPRAPKATGATLEAFEEAAETGATKTPFLQVREKVAGWLRKGPKKAALDGAADLIAGPKPKTPRVASQHQAALRAEKLLEQQAKTRLATAQAEAAEAALLKGKATPKKAAAATKAKKAAEKAMATLEDLEAAAAPRAPVAPDAPPVAPPASPATPAALSDLEALAGIPTDEAGRMVGRTGILGNAPDPVVLPKVFPGDDVRNLTLSPEEWGLVDAKKLTVQARRAQEKALQNMTGVRGAEQDIAAATMLRRSPHTTRSELLTKAKQRAIEMGRLDDYIAAFHADGIRTVDAIKEASGAGVKEITAALQRLGLPVERAARNAKTVDAGKLKQYTKGSGPGGVIAILASMGLLGEDEAQLEQEMR